jgi:hypothetical protein
MELLTLTQTQNVLAAFVGSISESITLTETAYARGWYQIDTTDTANWTLINNAATLGSGTNAIAELPFSTTSGGNGAGSQWRLINTAENAIWTLINDNQ